MRRDRRKICGLTLRTILFRGWKEEVYFPKGGKKNRKKIRNLWWCLGSSSGKITCKKGLSYRWVGGKESARQCRRHVLDPWYGRERNRVKTPQNTCRHTQLHLPQELFCDYGHGRNYFIFTLMLRTWYHSGSLVVFWMNKCFFFFLMAYTLCFLVHEGPFTDLTTNSLNCPIIICPWLCCCILCNAWVWMYLFFSSNRIVLRR